MSDNIVEALSALPRYDTNICHCANCLGEVVVFDPDTDGGVVKWSDVESLINRLKED